MGELRLDNFGRAKKNAEFVAVELDRIEGKIQALAEMAVNRQDPDFLSSQVDSAAESMRQTEKAVSELQHLTGLADQLEEPPAILETDLRGGAASMMPDVPQPRRPDRSARPGSPRGPRSWRICISPARPRRSSCTATPTTCSASAATMRSRYGVLAEFLAEQLFGRWSLVLHYDLGRGLRAFAGRDERAAQGHGHAREQEAGRPQRAAEGSRSHLCAHRPLRAHEHHGARRTIARVSR